MVRAVIASAQGGAAVVKRPWLGAKLQAVTPEIAESLHLKRPVGALVASVAASSPAARAGLRTGDLIVSVDGQAVDDVNAFDYRFATKPLGGRPRSPSCAAGAKSTCGALEAAPEAPREETVIKARSPLHGAKVANLSPALADELRLDTDAKGVAVIEVETARSRRISACRRATSSSSSTMPKISTTQDLVKAMSQPRRLWRLTIQRGGQQISAMFGG